MKEMIWDINELTDLNLAMEDLLRECSTVSNPGALVLALHGDLGSGKTTFTQLLAKQLGVTEAVTSPTFVIMKRYETTNEHWTNLIHIDAYRLETVDELSILGFSTLLEQKNTIICIEWAERVAELLPADTISLYFTHTKDGRTLTLK